MLIYNSDLSWTNEPVGYVDSCLDPRTKSENPLIVNINQIELHNEHVSIDLSGKSFLVSPQSYLANKINDGKILITATVTEKKHTLAVNDRRIPDLERRAKESGSGFIRLGSANKRNFARTFGHEEEFCKSCCGIKVFRMPSGIGNFYVKLYFLAGSADTQTCHELFDQSYFTPMP